MSAGEIISLNKHPTWWCSRLPLIQLSPHTGTAYRHRRVPNPTIRIEVTTLRLATSGSGHACLPSVFDCGVHTPISACFRYKRRWLHGRSEGTGWPVASAFPPLPLLQLPSPASCGLRQQGELCMSSWCICVLVCLWCVSVCVIFLGVVDLCVSLHVWCVRGVYVGFSSHNYI